ncbi:MAG: hypothetical protein JO071_03080 [Deltaproteobacteria bacterium]|nr:hypothetical protein [Deltaproteobacteria bacterium]
MDECPWPAPQQDQIGHQGYRHQALDPVSILGHLVLPHAHHFLPFLEKQFHRPASEVACRRSEVRAIRHMIGVAPQEDALYPMLTAAENLRFFGRIY